MKIQTVYDLLNEISPFELQEEWDNSGLLVGEWQNDVKKIYLSLDIDDGVIEKADENSLIIAHHPVIFRGLKSLVPTDFASKYTYKLIQKNISYIAMHTNFDKTHLNEYFAKKVLGFEGVQEGFVFYSDIFMDFDELCGHIKSKMNLKMLKTVKSKTFIKRLAITTGAGMSLLGSVKADCFLTGDIKYHEAMDAKARGVSLVDIGHFESERCFTDALFEAMRDFDIEIIKTNSENPFEIL